MRQRLSLCSLLAAAAALQPAARKPTGGRRPTRRHMSAEQTDPVLEVERLENAIAASTEPDEQKALAEKLGMSRMSAEMSVLSANAAFYDAFQSCDVAKMKAVWSDSDDVTCVHPGHPLISGADLVLNSWRALFSSAGGMPKLEAQRQRVVLRGSAAWVTCNEAPEGEPSALEAINVFERRDGRWRVSASEASPRPRRDVHTQVHGPPPGRPSLRAAAAPIAARRGVLVFSPHRSLMSIHTEKPNPRLSTKPVTTPENAQRGGCRASRRRRPLPTGAALAGVAAMA